VFCNVSDLVLNAMLCGIAQVMLLSNGVSLPKPSARHHHGDVRSSVVPFSTAATDATQLAVAHIVAQFATGSTEEGRKATCEARKLSKHSLFYGARLLEANAVPWLLCLLFTMDGSMQDNAVAAFVKARGIGFVVDIVNVGTKMEAQQNAMEILFSVSSTAEYAQEIGHFPEAIPTLARAAHPAIREGAAAGKKRPASMGCSSPQATTQKVVAARAVAALTGLRPPLQRPRRAPRLRHRLSAGEDRRAAGGHTDRVLASGASRAPRRVPVQRHPPALRVEKAIVIAECRTPDAGREQIVCVEL
jgi:hypothetical protein